MTERLAYPLDEAAAVLGIGKTSLYAEIKAGQIKTITVGRRRRLITRQELEEYVERASARVGAA